MKFVLSKKGGTLREVNEWASDTMAITRRFGLRWPRILLPDDDEDDVTSLIYECSEEEYKKFINEFNLEEEHNIHGVRFLKSS